MEIEKQAEILLRSVGYETKPWQGGPVPAVCFESQDVIGFLHVFGSADGLLSGWEAAQRVALVRHAAMLRSAGMKTWNVYSVFVTNRADPTLSRRIERIEEDFALARKIARAGLETVEDLASALMPLLPLTTARSLMEDNYSDRLRSRLKDLPQDGVRAFLGSVPAVEVARILGGAS